MVLLFGAIVLTFPLVAPVLEQAHPSALPRFERGAAGVELRSLLCGVALRAWSPAQAHASSWDVFDREYDLNPGSRPAVPWDSDKVSGDWVPPENLFPPPQPRKIFFRRKEFPSYAFRPQTAIVPLIVKAIDLSRRIQIAMYSLDEVEIGRALKRAKDRGGEVRLVLNWKQIFPIDQEGNPKPINPVVQMLLQEGFEMKVLRGGGKFGSMHNKFALFDETLLETGSYNWKETAEKDHFENVVFRDDKEFVQGYLDYWDWLWKEGKTPEEAFLEGMEEKPNHLQPPDLPQDPTSGVYFHGEPFPDYVFSPNGEAHKKIMKAILISRNTIDVAMFSFWSFQIAAALIHAKEKGRTVRILLDKEQAQTEPTVPYLLKKGMYLKVLSGPLGEGDHSRMHNKFSIFDWQLLQTGSYNYSYGAERRNYENVYFMNDMREVEAYTKYFEEMYRQAEPMISVPEPALRVQN